MTISIFKMVEHFNRTVVGVPARPVGALQVDERLWLRSALSEEVEEFCMASREGNLIGQVDALVDLIYFAAGGLTRMGVSAEQSEAIFSAVHNQNMKKNGGAKPERKIQHELDAVKPVGWTGPEQGIREILNLGDEHDI